MMEFDASASKTSFSPYYQQKNVNQKSLDNLKETTPSTHLPNRSPLQLLTLPQRLPLQHLNLLLRRRILRLNTLQLLLQLRKTAFLPLGLLVLDAPDLRLEVRAHVASGRECVLCVAERFEWGAAFVEVVGEGFGEGALDEVEVGEPVGYWEKRLVDVRQSISWERTYHL